MGKFQKKYTSEEVRQIFSEQGCECLDEYTDMLTPMKYRCECGALSEIRLFAFQKGSRCLDCGKRKMSNSLKKSFDEVKSIFEDAGYSLLSNEYLNNKTPLDCICNRGHQTSISFGNFRKGSRCKQCHVEDKTGKGNWRFNPDREEVEQNKKFRATCRSMVRRTLAAFNKEKIRRSSELLGYSPDDLKNHLYNHPNMSEIKDDAWTIDHIFPIQAFVDQNIFDVSLINCLDNLQPLKEFDNLSKNNKYCENEFKEFLKGKGVLCG